MRMGTAVVEPTEWFEVQRRRLGDPDDDVHGWKTVENGDRVGSRYMAGIEGAFENGPHEAQVISVRVDRGQAVTEGYFQLAFNLGGVSYQERYTSAIYANNHTAAITKRRRASSSRTCTTSATTASLCVKYVCALKG